MIAIARIVPLIGRVKNTVQSLSKLTIVVMKLLSASGPRIVPSTSGAMRKLEALEQEADQRRRPRSRRGPDRLLRAANAPTKQNTTTNAETSASGASSTLHSGLIAK